MTKQKFTYAGMLAFFYVFLLVEPAYAYLDPGTGSLIIQMLIAGLVSSIFAIKLYWKKVTDYLRRFF